MNILINKIFMFILINIKFYLLTRSINNYIFSSFLSFYGMKSKGTCIGDLRTDAGTIIGTVLGFDLTGLIICL